MIQLSVTAPLAPPASGRLTLTVTHLCFRKMSYAIHAVFNLSGGKVMNTLAARVVLMLVFIAFATVTAGDEDSSPTKIDTVQIIEVNGADLTGLNGHALTTLLKQAKQKGTTRIVVDLGSVSHMTPAGMESLTAGAQSFGFGNFAVANLAEQPAQLVRSKRSGLFNTYSSVQEAVAALRE